MNSVSLPRKFFGDLDMFSAAPLLRARKEPETSSYTSGILSVLLGLLFLYVFAAGMRDVLTYEKINSTQTETKLSGEQVKATNVFFGVRVGYLGLQESEQNFDIGVLGETPSGEDIPIEIEPCNMSKWSALGQKYESQFNQYSLSQFFCPKSTDYLNVNKVYYAPNSTSLRIYVKPCTTGPKCNNDTTQKQFVKKVQDIEGSIFMTVYFMDTLISPNQKESISRTINTDPQFSFTMKRGIIGTIELATYKLTTDVGYFPVPEIEEESGTFVNSYRETSYQIVNETQNYALIYISMNRRFIHIERQVGKFDEMLSYAGGLFSIIVGFLKIFMFSYNEYRYELMVAEGVCNNDDNGNIIREYDFSFYKYVKYTIYDWVQILFCYQLDWKDCKLVEEAREEASSHLDVTNLFRKINSFEAALQHLLEDNEKSCLSLIKPHSLNQKRRDRLILEYYSTIINGEHATTVEEYKTAQGIMQFSLKIYQKSIKTNRVINSDAVDQAANDHHLPQILNFHRKSQTTQDVIQLFPDITQAALDIELSQEMKEIEEQLAEAYFTLEPEKRSKLERHIPIKILIRLKTRHLEMQKAGTSYGDMSDFQSHGKF